ncbi:MAG: ParB/RepB/Spo0J family partition protein [Phycisphaerales bacterium]|nr:ParB/RepB/Spo0J family partition protein [Phycisphaerales bacterium]
MKFLTVPIGFVRPFAGQPRKKFPKAALRELADSIAAVGQIVPAIVKPLGPDSWELIDGERRWQACKLAGVPTLKVVERHVADETEQYRLSVAANFGRADHTPLEIACAVHALRESGMTWEQVAGVFGKSTNWCQYYIKLMGLDPDVAELLDGESDGPRLHTGAAVRIAELPPKLQRSVAKKAIANGYGLFETNRLIRQTAKEHAIKLSGRERVPSDDWEVLVKFLHGTYKSLQPFLEMSEEELQALFVGRTDLQLQRFATFPERVAGEFSILAESLEKRCRHVLRKRGAVSRSA